MALSLKYFLIYHKYLKSKILCFKYFIFKIWYLKWGRYKILFCDAKNEVHSRLRSLRFSPNVKLAKMIINININCWAENNQSTQFCSCTPINIKVTTFYFSTFFAQSTVQTDVQWSDFKCRFLSQNIIKHILLSPFITNLY